MEGFDHNKAFELYDPLVRRVMNVEDVTLGLSEQHYLGRYRGRIRGEDTAATYDQLSQQLKPYGITPLFRWDEGRHAIFLVEGDPKPKPSNPAVNLVLFVLTLFSVLLTGAMYGLSEPLPADLAQAVVVFIQRGFPFAASIIAILGAHEFGHYLAGRFHGIHVTLPYFIPMPFSPFGTMGAFINMKGAPKNRRALLDVGIAGPLAGLVVTIPVLLLGLSLSTVEPLPLAPAAGTALQLEGNSLLYLLSKLVVFGRILPEPPSYGGVAPLLYWARYFFTGAPSPLGGIDVLLHPVAWAGWAGILVTGLNLIPAGQLDGGHMLYVLFGRKTSQRILPFILAGLALLGWIAWRGWWLWAVLIYFLGRTHAEPLDQITALDSRRKALAVVALLVFVLTFTPVPLKIF